MIYGKARHEGYKKGFDDAIRAENERVWFPMYRMLRENGYSAEQARFLTYLQEKEVEKIEKELKEVER